MCKDLQWLLLDEGVSRHEIRLDPAESTVRTIERGGKVAGFFSYRFQEWGVVLDHFVVAKWARNTTLGARLYHEMKQHLRNRGIHRVSLSLKVSNPKLSLFLQRVLHAQPYAIDAGCVDMILEV